MTRNTREENYRALYPLHRHTGDVPQHLAGNRLQTSYCFRRRNAGISSSSFSAVDSPAYPANDGILASGHGLDAASSAVRPLTHPSACEKNRRRTPMLSPEPAPEPTPSQQAHPEPHPEPSAPCPSATGRGGSILLPAVTSGICSTTTGTGAATVSGDAIAFGSSATPGAAGRTGSKFSSGGRRILNARRRLLPRLLPCRLIIGRHRIGRPLQRNARRRLLHAAALGSATAPPSASSTSVSLANRIVGTPPANAKINGCVSLRRLFLTDKPSAPAAATQSSAAQSRGAPSAAPRPPSCAPAAPASPRETPSRSP